MGNVPESAKYFTAVREIVSRPNFDADFIVTLENFASLVGEYQLDEDVACQLDRQGTLCRREHRHGWVAKAHAGAEAMIGGVCAAKYFNANHAFSTERNRIRRENNIRDYLTRLRVMVDDPAFPSLIQRERSRLSFLRESVDAMREELPAGIVRRIEDMVRTGNNSVVIEYRYEEKQDDGRIEYSWQAQQIASLVGVSPWNQSATGLLFTALREIRETLPHVELGESAGERRLKKWLDTLSGLQTCTSQIDELTEDWNRFIDPENLQKLWLLTNEHSHRIKLVQFAQRALTSKSLSETEARRILDDLRAEIRSRNLGRDFRSI